MKALSRITRTVFWSFVVLLVLVRTFASVAQAQTPRCGGYADVLADLATAYHERIVWVGERGAEGQLVITAAPSGSTWTAMLVSGEVACLVSAGTGWTASATGEDI